MWKLSKYIAVIIILGLSVVTYAQNCNLTVSGFVKDLSTDTPIIYANIFVKELQSGYVTDSAGYFSTKTMCPGKYHVSISHIRCETQELYLHISGDTVLTIFLDHNSHLLNEVSITGEGGEVTTEETQSLNSENITQNSNKNLASMLENISGVSTINNGSGISNPVVDGLYGNRISILNNGIVQSGQQWGVDHSPEIDPLAANRITVIKGVGALEYQGSSLGSIILVEPEKIDIEPHLHGEARYFFETNGFGNGLNLELQQYSKVFGWRAIGTLKKSGDNRTSKYFLRNTGNQEANIALQFEKLWNNKWYSDLYFSSFNADYGILRGSHIGNLTDLEEAFERDVPFFTQDQFSYSISAPYQKVNHILLKFHTKYSVSEKQWFDITYAGQYNLRKEFDVRRSGRSDIPALSLKQSSNYFEVKYKNYLKNNWELKSGIQLNRIDNTNLPETGILPLIPDYITYEFGVFGIISKTLEKTTFELGGRYDFENRKVATISSSIPREIIRFENDYHNFSGMVGISYQLGDGWEVAYNFGSISRNPEVNELYSNGLHQGVAGIEEGDPNLGKEISFKNTLSIKGAVKDKLFFEGLFYFQQIDNFIFLNPQDEVRLTIRGAFPVFKYEQTDARLIGFDLTATYKLTERLNITGKYSYLNGHDLSNDIPLVYMPPNNLYADFSYYIPKFEKLQNIEFQINSRLVFEQKNILPSQDFVAPPGSYYLIGLKASAEKQLSKLRLNMYVRVENLLNETYRDYLNRQRYFADDLGFNLIVGINISF
ncbi:MAG TPA: TonB-dependent receptor [Bacteroidales bacterium]|jgi:iron complex outermembrane receptor protein|nr:TonB-dependent receptor [Bacteroidales bacterium]|tara:strand:+ start:77 stop:2392 length:2316 start_codon:yes stop_codon:yes gene_type:complete